MLQFLLQSLKVEPFVEGLHGTGEADQDGSGFSPVVSFEHGGVEVDDLIVEQGRYVYLPGTSRVKEDVSPA